MGGSVMASIINAGQTALTITPDTTGALNIQANGTSAIAIDTSQNVGIGTSSPETKLHVTQSNDALPALQLRHGDGDFILMEEGGGTDLFKFTRVAGTNDLQINNITANNIRFATNNTERMRISSGGDVLINTTTAGLKLTVDSGITIRSTDQSTCRLVLENTTSPGRTFSLVAGTVGVGNDDFTIYDNTAAATRVKLKADGEFIIGTADQGAYNLQCNGIGVWGAGAYVNGSDARIKDDIAPIESGLDVVEKLNPVTYRYKEDWSKDQSTQTGFIAQELLVALEGKNYVDGVVQQGGSEGYYSVAYQNIIPILTKAIQELKAELDANKPFPIEFIRLKGLQPCHLS